MSDDLCEAYNIPKSKVRRAGHMDQIKASDGTEFYVLVSASTGENQLVHADVVDYDGALEHPMVGGLVGFFMVLQAFLTPVSMGYFALGVAESAAVTVGIVFASLAGGWWLANLALNRTRFGDWLFRFLEWNDHKALIMTRGETA